MTMIHLRHRTASVIQTYQNGIISVLPNSWGNSQRQYSLNTSHVPRRKNLLRHNERLIRTIRHIGGGVVKSPLGPCAKIPNHNVVQHIYKNSEQWMEEPATVSIKSFSLIKAIIKLCTLESRSILMVNSCLGPVETWGSLFQKWSTFNFSIFEILPH